jgi:hypothetical protein
MGQLVALLLLGVLVYAFWYDNTGQAKKREEKQTLDNLNQQLKKDWYRKYLYDNYSKYQYFFWRLINEIGDEDFDKLFRNVEAGDLRNKEIIYRLDEELSNTLSDLWKRDLNKFVFVILCIQYAKADILERINLKESWVATVMAREGRSFFPDNKFYTDGEPFDY